MSRRSLDSQTPIMTACAPTEKNTSLRLSTISNTPSFSSQNSDYADIRTLTNCLSRLENKRLAAQRVVLSQQKTDTMSKLALSAKVERALGRRMTNQDAIYKPKAGVLISEKPVKA